MEPLALHGGTPVRESLLPYGQQWVDDDDIETVVKVLKSAYLTQGPEISKFEKMVADAAHAEFAVAFCNGTAALHGASFAAGIGPGDEVITTPLTFAASSNCVLYQGGTPIFADVEPSTYLLALNEVQSKLTAKTKAIIPVDFTGQPVDMRAFAQFAKEHNLVFIQDAAHSLGALFDGKPVGSIADMTMFSFHPVKPVTTGEGGVIVTNDRRFYDRLLLFRTHGILRDPQQLVYPSEGPWYYEMQELGYNYRITDIQAALGASQMTKLHALIARRQAIADRYTERFADLRKDGLIATPNIDHRARSGWHLYIIQLHLERLTAGRRQIFEALRAENIGVNVHYKPVYQQPYYQKIGYDQGLCPIAEGLYESFITLPLFPKMSDQDIDDVVKAVTKVIRNYQNI
jgi:UDP-4-amino-4,6-dideoxy-N-acetyl-beta-L-altrosamine transaminase